MKVAFISIVALLCLMCGTIVAGDQPPVGSLENPKQVTSKDLGPDIDPAALANSPYSGIPLFKSFRSFMSSSYATAQVWVYAENDDPELYDTDIIYPYWDFYTPTWGELFDHIARQLRCEWKFNPENRQFCFYRSNAEPFFGVTIADGWRFEDRGFYLWFAPEGQPVGMDVYYMGHYTPAEDATDLFARVRKQVALMSVAQWPDPPNEDQLQEVKIGDIGATYLTIPTPRPGGVWHQWSFILDGHAFLIVSTMEKVNEPKLLPQVRAMVESFKIRAPTTQPTD